MATPTWFGRAPLACGGDLLLSLVGRQGKYLIAEG
jgi:hypothetical protein